MRVVIVDDEPGARAALRALVNDLGSGTRVVGVAANALEGIRVIQQEKPDLVLLDIEMPNGSGFDLLEAFPERPFQVVYTTAHEEHAVRAAHTHPFDYLLKPVDPDDLARAVRELAQRAAPGNKRIAIASVGGTTYINVQDIIHVEADGGYSTVRTLQGERHVASRNLGYFEELLPKERFYRCHNSHLVDLNSVRRLSHEDGGSVFLADGSRVPVSDRRANELRDRLAQLG